MSIEFKTITPDLCAQARWIRDVLANDGHYTQHNDGPRRWIMYAEALERWTKRIGDAGAEASDEASADEHSQVVGALARLRTMAREFETAGKSGQANAKQYAADAVALGHVVRFVRRLVGETLLTKGEE